MAKPFDARRLDVMRFAEDRGEFQADEPLSAFSRLAAETAGREALQPVHWEVRSEVRNPTHVQPEVWLHLQARAVLPLVCQRCLGPVETVLEVDRSFRFVSDEATAAAEDDESEEDVLAMSRAFDLRELLEDELLMELPLVPRHDTCPVQVTLSAVDDGFEQAQAEKVNPFAALERLKQGKS